MFRAWGLEIGRGSLSWQVKGAVASVATGFCGGIWLAERIGSAGETVTESGRLACTPKIISRQKPRLRTHFPGPIWPLRSWKNRAAP
jgi:hypothetical protein